MASLIDRTGVAFARRLAGFGAAPALLTAERTWSYRDLADRVDELTTQLGRPRRLVLLAGTNSVDAIATYLAALAAGHPVLLAPGDRPEVVTAMTELYDPDVVAGRSDGSWRLTERRTDSGHAPHPDLALLLSTSGSTGSAKLVRLSHQNLQANAEAIAGYLGIEPTDRAPTTLPISYCYGLSVVNSHLLRGAGLIVTDESVASADFWELFRSQGGTSLAGVPYTFDLLDRVGFARMRLPRLRTVTQAGGRLAPDRVRHYAALARRGGWRLFVMYGQTEATARMAYLPPERAESRSECIGVPVPGGSFRLAPVPDLDGSPDTGELVYSGPNVMLGYATGPADLSLGRTVDELHTGDLARRHPDGLYEIVGRRSRFLKLYGLRVDLGRVEESLARAGVTAWCTGDDHALVVAVAGQPDLGRVRRLAAAAAGLPARAVRAHRFDVLPRLPSGKPDYAAVLAASPDGTAPASTGAPTAAELCALVADVLDEPRVTPADTFVGLGGDSLSYVEMSIRLERAIGPLPDDWHTTPIARLVPAGPVRAGRRRLDTGAFLRAVAILLIVGTHAEFLAVPGGAHLLLGACGYNFARFHLSVADRIERLRGLGRSIGRIALASMLWIGMAALVTGDYRLTDVLLLHYFAEPRHTFNEFWFIEALVYTLVVLLALLAIPWVDRLERRHPFALPLALMALALVTRYELHPGGRLPTPLVAFWLFALGWAAAKADATWQRVVLSAAALLTVPGFFGDLSREAIVIAGLNLLIWVRTIPSHAGLNHLVAVLGGSSLFIYLTHWQVYPLLFRHNTLLAFVTSLAVGIAYAAVARRLGARLSHASWWRRLRGYALRRLKLRP